MPNAIDSANASFVFAVLIRSFMGHLAFSFISHGLPVRMIGTRFFLFGRPLGFGRFGLVHEGAEPCKKNLPFGFGNGFQLNENIDCDPGIGFKDHGQWRADFEGFFGCIQHQGVVLYGSLTFR